MTTDGQMRADGERDALLRATAVLDRVSSAEPWQEHDDGLAEVVAGLDLLAQVVAAQSAKYLAEVAARGLPGKFGHGRLAHWIRQTCPTMSASRASAQERRAEQLYRRPVSAELAATRRAMLAGQLR